MQFASLVFPFFTAPSAAGIAFTAIGCQRCLYSPHRLRRLRLFPKRTPFERAQVVSFQKKPGAQRRAVIVGHCLKPQIVEIEGFEPSLTEPESVVLPLHHISMALLSERDCKCTEVLRICKIFLQKKTIPGTKGLWPRPGSLPLVR